MIVLVPSKLTLLSTQQANKSRVECWGKEQWLYLESQWTKMMEDSAPKKHLTWVRIQASFICTLKEEGKWLIAVNFSVKQSLVPVAVHIVLVIMVLLISNKIIVIFLSCNFLSLHEWRSGIPLKVRALGMALIYISGYMQHSFMNIKGTEPGWLSTCSWAQGIELKE